MCSLSFSSSSRGSIIKRKERIPVWSNSKTRTKMGGGRPKKKQPLCAIKEGEEKKTCRSLVTWILFTSTEVLIRFYWASSWRSSMRISLSFSRRETLEQSKHWCRLRWITNRITNKHWLVCVCESPLTMLGLAFGFFHSTEQICQQRK